MNKGSFEALLQVLQALQQLKLPHMVVGSFSCNAYAMPRATKDADIVVQLTSADLDSILELLGDEFHLDRQLSFETLTNSTRNVLTYRPSKFDIELFRFNEKDAHHRARFARRLARKIPGLNIETNIPTPEDVIIQKLRWQRDKDISDARNVLQSQLAKLDWKYLKRWTDEHKTSDLLEKLKNEAM